MHPVEMALRLANWRSSGKPLMARRTVQARTQELATQILAQVKRVMGLGLLVNIKGKMSCKHHVQPPLIAIIFILILRGEPIRGGEDSGAGF